MSLMNGSSNGEYTLSFINSYGDLIASVEFGLADAIMMPTLENCISSRFLLTYVCRQRSDLHPVGPVQGTSLDRLGGGQQTIGSRQMSRSETHFLA